MIYTVTLNPAVDKTVTINDFMTGEVNRTDKIRTDAGGKGLNVSKCLASLGAKSTAAMFLGGNAGNLIRSFLYDTKSSAHDMITPLIVDVPGETRTNLKIVDPQSGTTTDINEKGPVITTEAFDKLTDMIFSSAHEGDILVLSGSVPHGLSSDVYARLISKADSRKIKTFLDTSGESLVSGINAVPFLIKPNVQELTYVMGHSEDDANSAKRTLSMSDNDINKASVSSIIITECDRLLASGISRIVVSAGADGAFYFSEKKRLRGISPSVPVQSTVGAGDSMIAALAYGESVNMDEEEAFRLALAFGTASVQCPGSSAPSKDDVKKMINQIKITILISDKKRVFF